MKLDTGTLRGFATCITHVDTSSVVGGCFDGRLVGCGLAGKTLNTFESSDDGFGIIMGVRLSPVMLPSRLF